MDKKTKSLLINPILTRNVNEHHRAATPLELFYDLIYVVAIASLAAELHHTISNWHHVGHALFMYCLVFFSIWWPWNCYTWFASAYDTDDAQFRLMSLAQMVGVIIIAVGVKSAFVENDFFIMMIGYVTMRIPLVFIWFKVYHDDEKSRPVALRYIIGIFIIQLAWVMSILYFKHLYVFLLLIFFEILLPYIAEKSVDKGKNNKFHFGHIEERLGLLTIIVLGESILAVVYAVDHLIKNTSIELITLAIGSVLILFSMWWLYFDDTLDDKLASEKKSFIWGYGHYFIYAFATAVGVMISVNVDVLISIAKLDQHTASMGFAIAVAGYLLSVWLCHDYLLEKKGLALYELPLLALVVIIIAFFTHSVLLISLAFVTLNAIRLVRQHKQCSSKQNSQIT